MHTCSKMFLSERNKHGTKSRSTTPDLDESNLLDVADVDLDESTQKRHFLDYDAVPPPDFEESFDRALTLGIGTSADFSESVSSKASITAGEQLKMDKKYERDGEVSDYELAACGYTKKEFTQDDNTLHMISRNTPTNSGVGVVAAAAALKPKHFLDENPIPPDYMLEQELREVQPTPVQRTESPASISGSGRKSSLDRASSNGSRSSRERYVKEPSYTLSRFLDSDTPYGAEGSASSLPPPYRLPKGSAWTESFDSRYSSLQLSLPPPPTSMSAVDEPDNLGPKVECVYSLLSMLGANDPLEMSKKFLELSRTPETCATLRRSGCIPLLVQMVYSEGDENVRKCATAALHNVVHSHPEEKTGGRREAKVLRLLDQIVEYCNFLKTLLQSGGEAIADDSERHPLAAISSLMKVSFDEEHRHAMVELGALHAIPNLVQLDHAVHGPKPEDQCCNSLRRYALMALTNLTFGDELNKALLCSQKTFMEALVAQLDSAPDDLLQVTASVLRNLSWRADNNMKTVLNEIGTVTALARAAMQNKSENTLKAILSALWNLSAHCSTNKAEFCAVDGALAFLVDMLTYEGPSKTLKIIENAGGILRNVSSHIAVRENYRQILRERNCLAILLQQLKSESLTVVSNSCGTLWNLSARCPEDQKFLWDNGAVTMLRSLIHSKHTMISEGSSSALKNLLNFRPSVQNASQLDPIARSMGLKKLPTLNVRKQKALEQELGEQKHAETCDNLDIAPHVTKEVGNTSVFTEQRRFVPLAVAVGGAVVPAITSTSARLTRSAMLTKSESRDSVFSAKSDSAYENLMRSHSASDANRAKAMHAKFPPFTALGNDVEEPTEEQPVDYSVKYNEHSSANQKTHNDEPRHDLPDNCETSTNYATYQETDLDQPTDFSLRYAENQIESDADAEESRTRAARPNEIEASTNNGSEILLILEDSVKCYQTEDTPYVISNAASVTDLRQNKPDALAPTQENGKLTQANQAPARKYQQQRQVPHNAPLAYGSGSYTPEKPVNYCEEGTPGYFSRYESLSSLDESPPQASKQVEANNKKPPDVVKKPPDTTHLPANSENVELPVSTANTSMLNSALETPLMFSRHSSMDSLVEADVGPLDDKCSVISDTSLLASGVISPSEIPDSPTQSMPQSPRQYSAHQNFSPASGAEARVNAARAIGDDKRPLRSVFEDDLNTFHVENTPAQFSCATSLSNLSIMDDDTKTPAPGESVARTISEGEEEEESTTKNDDLLLASCINMGMNRATTTNGDDKQDTVKSATRQMLQKADQPQRYCTEDTPALLSKMGSNTNLSAISICSSDADCAAVPRVGAETTSAVEHKPVEDKPQTASNRHSINLSDDVSSNASECGAGVDILQQCIRDGMKKPMPQLPQVQTQLKMNTLSTTATKTTANPIAMMRCGGGALSLPSYLPVSDEMNKFLVEDSPCNFSIMSGLSNLTVGSSLVGPATKVTANSAENPSAAETAQLPAAVGQHLQEDVRRGEMPQHQKWQDDSLSSLSIDSEDDTNLLSQVKACYYQLITVKTAYNNDSVLKT